MLGVLSGLVIAIGFFCGVTGVRLLVQKRVGMGLLLLVGWFMCLLMGLVGVPFIGLMVAWPTETSGRARLLAEGIATGINCGVVGAVLGIVAGFVVPRFERKG